MGFPFGSMARTFMLGTLRRISARIRPPSSHVYLRIVGIASNDVDETVSDTSPERVVEPTATTHKPRRPYLRDLATRWELTSTDGISLVSGKAVAAPSRTT